MEMLVRQDNGDFVECRPDGWPWGAKETDGSFFAIIHVTESWMEGDWMSTRQAYDDRNEDGSRVWSVRGDNVYNNGTDTGLTLEYTTLYGTVPSAD